MPARDNPMLEPFDRMADDVACVIGEGDPTECKGCPHNRPFACFRCPIFLELKEEYYGRKPSPNRVSAS